MPTTPAHPIPPADRATPSPDSAAQRAQFPARLTRVVGAATLPALFFAAGQANAQTWSQSTPDGAILDDSIAAPTLRLNAIEGADEIIVTGRYLANEKFSATKTPTPVINVPQALTITTEEQIEDQAFQNLGDILRYTVGAAAAQGEGHRDQITLRGQNTTADFFLDGVRDDVQYFRPLYNLEQVEILRGSNALIFGRGGGGGAVNRVTKRPGFGETFGSVSVSADTFGAASVAGDVNFDAGDTVGLRLNAFYERLDNHRDNYDGDRFAINPTAAVELTPDTRLDLSYEYVDDNRVVDRGVPSLNGEPLSGFNDTFFGSPDLNNTTLQANIVRARIDHQITEGWSANATLHYADYEKAYQNLYPIGISLDDSTVSLDGYRDLTDRENLIAQGNLVAEFDTGSLSHTLLLGAEYGRQDTSNSRRDALFADSQDDQITFAFTDPLAIPAVSFPAFTRDRASNVEFASLYVQDQIAITDTFQLIGGLRYDSFSIDVDDAIAARQLSSSDDKLSPRLGAIWKPQENISVYASHSRTFLPRSGDQFLTLTPTSAALDPEAFRNSEVGIKWDIVPTLSFTTALFELERDGGSITDPTNPDNSLLVGSNTTGFEAQLSGRLWDALTINAGYAYLDADESGRVVESAIANRTLPSVPEHMAFLWGHYDLSDRFGIAAGVTHQSSQFASLSNAVELPAYTRVDAALYYEASDAVTVQLNIENLFDTTYYPAAHNDNNISTGEPINARLTLRSTF